MYRDCLSFRPLLGALAMAFGLLSCAAAAQQQTLPPEVEDALRRAKVPASALAAVVQETELRDASRDGARSLAWNPQRPVNPASVFKLITTFAALDQLGPAFTWATPVYINGTLKDGVLDGSVSIEGRGDPKLVIERVWLLLRRLQQMGVREIRGDIVLDHSLFAPAARAPAEFDNEPYKPQNVQPDALLMNFKSVTYTFVPDVAAGLARVGVEPALAGVQVDATVPLGGGTCEDWRAALKPELDQPARVHFAGQYASSCGERSWPIASADPTGYSVRLVTRLWHELGGQLGGVVRDGRVPPGSRLAFEVNSPPLAEVIRDINKFSNNVMAEQLFLSLAAQPSTAAAAASSAAARPASEPASAGTAWVPGLVALRPDDARTALRGWLASRFDANAANETVIDNGSGLSRQTRVSAQLLARLLQTAWASGVMPELMSSLPVTGTDGTLKRSTAAPGRAHLKTGSLRDVAALAGYVLSASGRRYVLVAIVNDPQALQARAALDALVQWTMRDMPARP